MGNEFITLVKDTALVRVISVYEIIWMGETYIRKGMIWPLFYTAVFYLLINGILTLLLGWFEKKMDYFRPWVSQRDPGPWYAGCPHGGRIS